MSETFEYPWHEKAWQDLSARLDRVPHALLFHGPLGIGKLALAERFARLLLCERRKAGRQACGSCEGCRWFSAGQHPDLRFVEPEALARHASAAAEDEGDGKPESGRKPSTEIRIDQVRALETFLNVGGHRGGWRVALVHPAEDMNLHAANALLKSLEEPGPGTVFLLVSHRPARLAATIRSRCVPIPLALPPAAASLHWLQEQGLREPGRWLAYAGGAPLRALALSAAGELPIERVRRALEAGDADSLAEVADPAGLESLVDALQKYALDRAFLACAGRAKYAPESRAGSAAGAGAWLGFARGMGQRRALASRPLNPRLLAAEMIAAIPSTRGAA